MDERLKNFIDKDLLVTSSSHPFYKKTGVGLEISKTAIGHGLVVEFGNGQSGFVFNANDIKPLFPEGVEEDEELSEEEIIEKLAGCNYGPSDIALYLGVKRKEFMEKWNDTESTIRYHYDRGRLLARVNVNQKLLDNAASGNITAAQIYEKNRRAIEVENLRNQIFFPEGWS